MPFITGVLLGLSTLGFIGPVFFYLVKSALESGFKAGLSVALGIVIADVLCLLCVLYGAQPFIENPDNQQWFLLIGACILLFMGYKFLFKPNLKTKVDVKYKRKSLVFYFINGFVINFVNPFVFLVWIGFVTYIESIYVGYEIVVALVTILLVIFTTDTLKALYARKLKKYIQPHYLKRVFQFFGIIMLGFGVRLLVLYFVNE